MTAKTQNVVVQQPDTNFRSREWDWHVWEQIGNGTERWLGFFVDTETALGWARSQPGNYIINNVPPMSSNQRTRPVRTGFPWDRDKKQKRVSTPTRKAQPQKRAVAASAVAPVRPVQRATDSAETKAMKKDAQVRFDQHKAAEAAELKAQEEAEATSA